MGIKLATLVCNSLLKDARLITGEKGLDKDVDGVSVYDAPIMSEEEADKLLEKRILYFTTLDQHRGHPDRVLQFIKQLAAADCAGLCITDKNANLIDGDVLNFMTANDIPLFEFDEKLSYSAIMQDLSIMLYFDDIHLANSRKIERIIHAKLSHHELSMTLESINSKMQKYICVMSLEDPGYDMSFELVMSDFILANREYSYVRMNDLIIYIISDNAPERVFEKVDEIKRIVNVHLNEPYIGVSTVCERLNIEKAVRESRMARGIGKKLGDKCVYYDKASEIPLLIMLRDTVELREFYDAVRDIITQDEGDNRKELIMCIEEYLSAGGNFANAARKLYLHENTIRYRINKVKNLLGYEENPVKFHQVISTFIEAGKILGEN